MVDKGRKGALKDKSVAGKRGDPGANRRDLRQEAQQGRETAAQIVEPGNRGEPKRARNSDPEERPAALAGVRQPEREPGCDQDADHGDAAAAGYGASVA